MSKRVAPQGYSLVQIVLHWTIAGLVVFQLVVNEAMQDAFKDRAEGARAEDDFGATLHIVVGLTVLALTVIRLAIRLRRGAPEMHRANPPLVNLIGHAAHVALYGFLVGMPVTGAIAWFTGLEFSAILHELGRFVLIPLIAAHVIGALAEHFVFKTDSLVRMLGADRK
jgi:cytochrome b561